MKPIMNVRQANLQDYDVICELSSIVDRYHCDHLPQIFQAVGGPVRERNYIEEIIRNPDTVIFLGEVTGSGQKSVAGYVSAYFRETPPVPIIRPARLVQVDTLVVHEEYRRMGLGRMLLDAVHTWAIEKNADAVELNVYEFNQDALRFYEEMGYFTLSRKMRYHL